MTGSGLRPIWRIGWLLLATATACLSVATATAARAAEPEASPGRAALVVHASPWILPSGRLGVTLEQRGVLAGRRLAILFFVDGNQLERVTTTSDRTQARLDMPALAPGRYILLAKTGSEVARTEFQVISWSWLAGSALLAGGGIGLFFLFRRRNRRHWRLHRPSRP